MYIIGILGFLITFHIINGQRLPTGGSEYDEEFLTILEYFGNVRVLHNILTDYSEISKDWNNPVFQKYDQKVVETLQEYVDALQDNETQHDLLDAAVGSVRILTNFCGPGNWSIDGEVTQNPYFTEIDQCCKTHDECPDTIVSRKDYKKYPGLPQKPQLFTRERCGCDAKFFGCLRNVATFFSYAVAWIYSKVQIHCFEFEYPVLQCLETIQDGLLSAPRCVNYSVENLSGKTWQWFNIPYLNAKQDAFPKVTHYHQIFYYTFIARKHWIGIENRLNS
ncbi:phospholipase A2-like [Uranotaenia lowii]|uniref:phospholipase A2-like n=1 Tax=Uranotaenia lowii TaxID=190385 RepID=UPI00247A6274|nr:phospholipase A2-like [Uranotaenia lowii]